MALGTFAVFLIEPQRTAFDLNIRLFGIDIRVHPIFWVFTAVLGWSVDWRLTVLWIGCVFVSILIHEMGHVFAYRLFGVDGHIVLYGLGGLAIGERIPPNRWQRVFVSFAGPLAQFILLGVMLGIQAWVFAQGEAHNLMAQIALADMIFINLVWPVLNLFPVWPLDGGKISRELCTWMTQRNGVRVSLVISIVTAGILAGIAIMLKQTFMAIFFGLFAFGSFQAMQMHQDDPWKRWD